MQYPLSSSNRSHTIAELQALCRGLRVDILEMITAAGSGHPGGSLSVVDLVATLYLHEMRHDPARPDWPERDRFVLSKGHGVPALYAVLAHTGYFSRELLPTLRQLGSPLQGHPVRGTAPGIEACTGSLGQGLSVAIGMALAARLDRTKTRVYCVMGDGELQEGQVWEAAMSAAKFELDNLVAFVDNNRGQIDGPVSEVMPIEPLVDKWQSFGWSVQRIDGHDFGQILDALSVARKGAPKPQLIVADTVKGKGVSFMESQLVQWHGAAPTKDERDRAIQELTGQPRQPSKEWP
jgi:transketolase